MPCGSICPTSDALCIFFTLCIFHPVPWTAYFSPCVFFTLCFALRIFHPTLEFPPWIFHPVYFSPCVFFTLCIFYPVPWTAYFYVFFTLPWNFHLCIFHPAPVCFSHCVFFTLYFGLRIFHPVYFSPCALD